MTDSILARRRSGIVCDKILRRHQERMAIVYVRQSTVQQVERNQESTRLQYALADRAGLYGWEREQIVVIDDDLGRSGASIEGRLGFQRLVAEVGLGNVGLVLGVEMSRLARSFRDWHQLLEICALFDTLTARAAELRREGLDYAGIAERLNREGWRPAKRRDTFNAPMVHHLLIKSGAESVRYRRRPRQLDRRPNEWTIRELAEEIGMPQPTLYAWIEKGRLSCRNPSGKRDKLLFADPETVTMLKAIRATPPPWRRLPTGPAGQRPTASVDS